MKVLMVISQFHPMIGGAEKQAKLLAEKLIKKGIDVTILTGWWKFGTPHREMVDGINVFRNFSCWGMFGIRGLRPLGTLTYMVTLALYLLYHKNEYDIIHVHQVLYPAFISVIIGKEFLGKPVLVKNACSGLMSDIKEFQKFPFGNRQLFYLIKKMDRLVTVNLEGENEFKSIGYNESHISYIPNGVTVPLEGKSNYSQVLRIITIARLDEQKGIDILIRAWAKVVQQVKTLKLIILGNGPQEFKLKTLSESLNVAHTVEFKGMVRNPEEYLRDADLFVLPSRAEGLSNALLEAMSHGIPCVVTNISGNQEALGIYGSRPIQSGDYIIFKNGVLVNPGDIDGLYKAILYVVQNRREREEIGKGGRLYIQRNYSIDLIVDRYIGLYRSILD